MNNKNHLPIIIIIALSVSIALVLWVTMFSRIGTHTRYLYPPFWSYRAIAKGSKRFLFENIGNIVLFIPIGITIALFAKRGAKLCLLMGFAVSLLIECCQWFFWLGSFEFDDLLHNTIGAGIGMMLVYKTTIGDLIYHQLYDRRKCLRVMTVLVVLFIVLPLGYRGIKYHEMKRLAALNNRENGEVNLLVLSPEPVYIVSTDVNITYSTDGSVLIAGVSNNRAWIKIADFTLSPGSYVFEGLSGIEEKTVGLELAIFNDDQNKFEMVGHEIGAYASLGFHLNKKAQMEVLISLYPGWSGETIARPAIYKENKY